MAEKSYFKIFLRADDKYNLYKLERYDLLTCLGDIGGLADITIMVSGFLSIIFATNIFDTVLTNSVFKVQNDGQQNSNPKLDAEAEKNAYQDNQTEKQ